MPAPPHVVVLGAGVTGLTTAVLLAEAGYLVTVIAAHVPGDSSIEYTSPWAGGHWRTHASVNEPMECDWDVQTFNYWIDLMNEEEKNPSLPKSGLKMYNSFHFWDGEIKEEIWWAPYVKNFSRLSLLTEPVRALNDQTPANASRIANAVTFQTMAINVPQYLLYLQERARKSGVIVFKSPLPTDGGLDKALVTAQGISKAVNRGKADCFVHATGLGARKLCGDEAMYPIRGQTILVQGEAKALRLRQGDGYIAYCIPRPGSGTTILGGTNEKGNWSEAVDPDTTTRILQRCELMVPELRTAKDGGFEVISVQCGLRPGRIGGPRMEKELVVGKKVVHAYGHAGAGYQNSIGSARMAMQMVEEWLSTRSTADLSAKLS